MFDINSDRDLFDFITLVIACVGCATAFLSFLMQILNKPKIEIRPYANKLTGFMTNPNIGTGKFAFMPKFALVAITVVSLKPFDTSIYKIELACGDFSTTYDSECKIDKVGVTDGNDKTQYIGLLDSSGQITLPYRLCGMEVLNLFLAFPYVQSLYSQYKDCGQPVDAIVRIHTSTQIVEYPVKLKDISFNEINPIV